MRRNNVESVNDAWKMTIWFLVTGKRLQQNTTNGSMGIMGRLTSNYDECTRRKMKCLLVWLTAVFNAIWLLFLLHFAVVMNILIASSQLQFDNALDTHRAAWILRPSKIRDETSTDKTYEIDFENMYSIRCELKLAVSLAVSSSDFHFHFFFLSIVFSRSTGHKYSIQFWIMLFIFLSN